jgi:hypothetical protein
MSLGEFLADMIALAALLVAVLAHRTQARLSRERTAIQAQVAAIEEGRRAEELEARRRAHVAAEFHPEVFVLRNEGPALARDVGCVPEALDNREAPVEL